MSLKLMSLAGLAVFIGLAWAISLRRDKFPWRTVLAGMGLQALIAAILIPDTAFGRAVYKIADQTAQNILAFAREGYGKTSFDVNEMLGTFSYPGFWAMTLRYWKTGLRELRRSLSRKAFLHDLQRLVPEVEYGDLSTGGSGVRAQAVDKRGRLLDDFCIVESEGAIHVLNAPSPGATSSLSIGNYIVGLAARSFDLGTPVC